MPRFSVIVPVYSGPALLSQCLRSIRASPFVDYELLVSDDGSPDADEIRSVAAQYEARLIRSENQTGAGAARNRAARVAVGDQLVFFDADVTLSGDTLTRIAQAFDHDPSLDAVIGAYDRQPSARNTTSQFRNLLHAHAHRSGHREATTFWTGCGAVQRERFLAMGGFDEIYGRPSIEDVEFGLRLHRAGGRIILAPEIEVTHHKKWTLVSMVRTDLLARAIPWAKLVREHGLPSDLNFHTSDRLAVGLTALAVPLAVVAVRQGPIYWGLFIAALAATAFLQASLLRFLAASKGLFFAARCFPLVLVYNLTCAVGLMAGLFQSEVQRDRWLLPTLGACSILIIGLQISGGAYHAEFDANADEAAHFVSGLMVYDYLTALPLQNPYTWAQSYYLHYPKVAIGHWPPGFYIMEGLWWLLVSPSRGTALLLNAVLMLLAGIIFYRLLRAFAPPWLCLAAALLLIATPVVVQSYSQTMGDLPCLLWSVLLADAMVRLLRRPSSASAGLVALWLICGLLTKGTAASLVLAPVIACVITGQWRILKSRFVLSAAAAVMLLGFGWYVMENAVFHENLRTLSGVAVAVPWSGGYIPALAGLGFFTLACGGVCVALLRRRPVAVASAAILLSIGIVAWFLRAMNDPRHFIIVIPALLALSVELLVWARSRTQFGILLGIPALALFPFVSYFQQPHGFTSLLKQIHRPARMLVSSNGSGEGAWIAEVALAEKRPASVVIRASKTLVSEGWNGENYQLITKTPEEIGARLDDLAIEAVIVDTDAQQNVPLHQLLLEQTVKGSRSWRRCAQAEDLTGYCRAKPPRSAPQPLQIDLTNTIGVVIHE